MERQDSHQAMTSSGPGKGCVLVVDDEVTLRRAYARMLEAAGFSVEQAASGQEALDALVTGQCDVLVSDIAMPGMDGMELLRAVRERDLDIPVVLVTGVPGLDSAIEAVELGAFRYLHKPVEAPHLLEVVARASQLHRMARLKRQALEILGDESKGIGDRASLEATFARGVKALWMAYQPIVRWSTRQVFGYEALLRTAEPTIPHPGAFFDIAERLGRVHHLGRFIRVAVAADLRGCPAGATVFMNIHPAELADDDLTAGGGALRPHADRMVLEITERAALEGIEGVRRRVASLKQIGFRIAVDDLGAGYAGLTSLAHLEPEVVKIDMSLVRDVHRSPTKSKLIQSITRLCTELGMLVIAEGVETSQERDAIVAAGCDFLQGFLFGRPERPFSTPTF